jgi:hypothetical protein
MIASQPRSPRRVRPLAAASLVLFLLLLYSRSDEASGRDTRLLGSSSLSVHRRFLSVATDHAGPAPRSANHSEVPGMSGEQPEDPSRSLAPVSRGTRGSGRRASSSGPIRSAAPAGSWTTWVSSTVSARGSGCWDTPCSGYAWRRCSTCWVTRPPTTSAAV